MPPLPPPRLPPQPPAAPLPLLAALSQAARRFPSGPRCDLSACPAPHPCPARASSQELKRTKKNKMKEIIRTMESFNNNLQGGKKLVKSLEKQTVRRRTLCAAT